MKVKFTYTPIIYIGDCSKCGETHLAETFGDAIIDGQPVPAVGGPDPWEERSHDQQIEDIVQRERDKRTAATADGPATQPQKKMLAAQAKRKGLTVAEDLRVFCADTIGRDITSAKDLTKAEASKVIDALIALPDKTQDN